MKIAILGGPANQARQLELWLRDGEHQTECFKSGNAFFTALRRSDFDLLMVDVALPDMSGIDLIAWARHHFEWHVPVIAMMARDTWQQAGDALKAGADDYLVRPAREADLQSRIATVTLRQAAEPEELLDFGAYAIDTKASKISLHGEAISLTRKEFELAAYFLRHPDQLISHETLLSRIWKLQSDIDTRTVATHVSRIRKKLLLDGTHGCEIMSLYGYGYRCLFSASEADRSLTADPAARMRDTPPVTLAAVAPRLSPVVSTPAAALAALPPHGPASAMSVAYGTPLPAQDSRPVDRYGANLLKERQAFEEEIRKLRDAYCEATLELRALKRQGSRRLHEVDAHPGYGEDAA